MKSTKLKSRIRKPWKTIVEVPAVDVSWRNKEQQ
jgi:hypothetical protein